MARKMIWPAVALFALGACGSDSGSGAEGAEQAGAGTADGLIQAHTIQQLMADVIQPTAENYWDSVRFESALVDGVAVEHDIVPVTDADWRATRAAAASLAEMGNLLMTPLYAEGRADDWMDFSRGLVEIGLRAEQAAIDRDPDAVFEVGGTLYNVCSGCHANYPPAGLSEGQTEAEILRPQSSAPAEVPAGE